MHGGTSSSSFLPSTTATKWCVSFEGLFYRALVNRRACKQLCSDGPPRVQTACALQGVANRDVKLENTLLVSSARPLIKLCDFGYSKVCIAILLFSGNLE